VYIRKLAVSSILLHQLSAFLISHHHPALWLVDQSTGSPGTRAPLHSCTVGRGGFLQRLLLPLWITDENQVPLSSCRGFFVGLLILMVDLCCVFHVSGWTWLGQLKNRGRIVAKSIW
jgi:hypothetical protein